MLFQTRISMFLFEAKRSILLYYKEFQDTKRVIRIRISKKNRQHSGQKKMYKSTNNDLQNIHIKLKIELQRYTDSDYPFGILKLFFLFTTLETFVVILQKGTTTKKQFV
jgi:16S rRNA U1498 N3-methylase RsmE